MKYRMPTRQEKTLLNRALDKWGVFEYFKEKLLMVGHEDDGSTKICLVSPESRAASSKLEPYSLGLVIGDLKKQFTPSLPGADLFARVGKSNEYYITVDENAEKLVLYGRDVMGNSILQCSDTIDENELVIILNSRNESIGVGRTRFAGSSLLQKGKITVTTLADAGQYLRDEG